jgi:hypothetical protein
VATWSIWWPVRCAAADLVARPLVAFLVELVAWCRPGQCGALVAFLVARRAGGDLVEPVATWSSRWRPGRAGGVPGGAARRWRPGRAAADLASAVRWWRSGGQRGALLPTWWRGR